MQKAKDAQIAIYANNRVHTKRDDKITYGYGLNMLTISNLRYVTINSTLEMLEG